MDSDDIIYLFTLVLSIGLGYFFQRIENPVKKKWFATVSGFLIVFCVTRFHSLHAIVLTLLIGHIIKYVSPRYCHATSFLFGFAYLIFFRMTEYFGIPYPTGHANMIQMILTLKLIGLAFEVHDNVTIMKKVKDESIEVSNEDLYREFQNPTMVDVFHYAFCYAGLLTGPYFTYRTYCDMFLYAKNEQKLCFKESLKTLAYVPLFMSLFLATSWTFPLERLHSANFYTETSFFYRLWYMYPTFFIFRMRMYIAFKLSEAVCMMAGLGLYPADTKPKLGIGPTTNFHKLELLKRSPIEAYSFEAIRTINIFRCEFCSTVREATRHWNRSIHYWLAAYVYHRFPFKNQRTLVTFFISSLWHGMHAGYYFSLFSVPLYLLVENSFKKRVLKDNSSKINNFILWNAKMFQFSYWGLAFQVKNYADVWKYGTSVFLMPYIVAAAMYVCSMVT
ncbi:hypothetical protein V9T40_005645 [Parthenolecanium corni]|uniref:Lysophospholipid acyltransferase 7 n=1 Tax=Parthenolecanium corni TaxID=536013 RepID=A0AAN9YAP2_9HEMI